MKFKESDFDHILDGATIKNDDFEISYACELPDCPLLALGSTDGRVCFLDSLSAGFPDRVNASESKEAINGIAMAQYQIIASTRQEITFLRPPSHGQPAAKAECPFGSHGLFTASSGVVVGPLGDSGVLFAMPTDKEEITITIRRIKELDLYFYRGIPLPSALQGDFANIAFAVRTHGIAIMHLGSEREYLRRLTFSQSDIIDICTFRSVSMNPLIIAVSRDCHIFAFNLESNNPKPLTAFFPSITGTAYKVLTVNGHVIILTSVSLFIVFDLAMIFAGSNRSKSNRLIKIRKVEGDIFDVGVFLDMLFLIDVDGISFLKLSDLEVDFEEDVSIVKEANDFNIYSDVQDYEATRELIVYS